MSGNSCKFFISPSLLEVHSWFCLFGYLVGWFFVLFYLDFVFVFWLEDKKLGEIRIRTGKLEKRQNNRHV